MPYFLISDFRAGLDVRKSILTAPAGSLTRLVNAAISPGGEIVKRRAFVKVADLSGTFGLAAMSNKVVAFTKNTTPANPGIKDPATGASPADVTLEYHRLPNTSPTSVLSDFDIFDGKLYVVLYDPTPSPAHPIGSSATLPKGVPEGTVYELSTDNTNWVWRQGNWQEWEADARGSALPERALPGNTFYNTTDKKNYVRKPDNTWGLWQAETIVAALPTAYKDGDVWLRTTDNLYFAWKTKEWVPFSPPAFLDTTNYAVGDFMTRNGNVYRATRAAPAGPFDNTAWEYIGAASSVRAQNPHYYMDDRDKINDKLLQGVDGTSEWTTKPNPTYGTYQETEGSGMGLFVRAYKSKMYCVGDKYLRFSAVDNAFLWAPATDSADTSRTGASYINVALQEGGSAQLRGVEIYYDKLALLSEYTTQIWSVTSDPKQAALGQVLRATGTRAPWSVQQYGSGDILFLASSGIRSLKARDLSNSAAVSDIGSPIDDYVRALPDKYAKTTRSGAAIYPGLLAAPQNWAATTSDKENFYYNARAILEPIVGRFWLAFPREIMVLSAFPGPDVTAWSVYTTPFNIDYIVVAGDRVFVRSGNDLYLFGGVSGEEYDNCGVEVRLPFHDGGKPGHEKNYMAIDATAQGEWDVAASTNYDNPDDEEIIGHMAPIDPTNPISTSSWNKGRYELSAYASHMSLRFYNRSAGPAVLSNAAIHYGIGPDAD